MGWECLTSLVMLLSTLFFSIAFCSFARGVHSHACLFSLYATPIISTGPHHSASPLQPIAWGPLPPPLLVPPIWLEQRVQTGQPSRSLPKAAEYSSSLGVSPPPLRPGLGPFNNEQVIQMEGGAGGGSEVGGRLRRVIFFVSYSFFPHCPWQHA